MNRPLLLRILPPRLRMSAWARLYSRTNPRWHGLYNRAPLLFAPQVAMDLVPGDIISASIAFTGVYELSHSRRIVEIARRGGTLIDIGANLGYFTLLWTASSPGNRCFAFEASPRVLKLLKRNIESNGLESQVRLFPNAAGREAGSFNFDMGPEEQTGWGGLTTSGDGVPVDVVRCDEVVHDDIDLLKIDVEGADTFALMGCERLLRERRIKHIWFEQNKPRMRKLGIEEWEAETFLKSVGYKAWPESDPSRGIVEWAASTA
jgi:FkbM family methyltransferase